MGYAIDLWKIVLDSNCSKETRINIKNGLDELNAKAKAFDEIVKLEKETSLYSVAGKEDVELGAVTRGIINKYMEDKQND